MEEIINKIIEIDKKTNAIKLNVEEFIEQKKLDLNETLYNLEKEIIIKTKVESEEIYEQIISQGKAEVTRIENNDKESLIKIHNRYNSCKIKLTEKLFENLFLIEE